MMAEFLPIYFTNLSIDRRQVGWFSPMMKVELKNRAFRSKKMNHEGLEEHKGDVIKKICLIVLLY